VQKELNLSDEQKAKVQELQNELMCETLPKVEPGQNMDLKELQKRLQTTPPEVREKEQKRLAEILKPEQLARLKEISLQAQGAAALRKPELANALGLTLEQRAQLNAAFKQADKQRSKSLQASTMGGVMSSGSMKPNELEQELMQKALRVLTPEQRHTFEKMKGKPVDLTTPPGSGGLLGGGVIQFQPPKNNN
jgi:Spy/CpxP family protein refolding chaperone